MEILTVSNIMFAVGMLSVIFTVFLYFKNPQVDLDKRQSVLDKEVDNKAEILTKQLDWEKESNERRFKDLKEDNTAAQILATNHIHSISVQLDGLTANVLDLSNRVTVISTILDERLPHTK